MNANSIHVKRTATVLRPDQSRVLLRPFSTENPQRAGRIIARIMSLPENRVGPLLKDVAAEFSHRHQQIHKSYLERFEQVRDLLLTDEEISEQRQLLIGSYFVCEFSLESAALFNPSIVPHPDQSDLPPGALRFILSLRATGEGHISSITFRTGIIHVDHRIEVLTPTGFLTEPRQIPNPLYEKALFERKLFELGLTNEFTRRVMNKFVETSDFLLFRFTRLSGPAAENKGMAMFPRKINGLYAMLSRQDNENIYLMFSDNVHFWYERKVLLKPMFPWELVQLGNCGSPIETEAGWLVLSHGVGPLRTYCIGAFLLDHDNPGKVIGRLREPLLKPDQKERKGYVPNVVYTCGALLHNGELIIPYGMADHATGFATVPLDEVLAAMH